MQEIKNFSYPHKIQLIVSDVDGTLVDNYKHISQENIQAIKNAQAAGCEVAIASGRTRNEMSEIEKNVPSISYFICCNGAYVFNAHTKEVLYQTGFSITEGINLLDELEPFDVYVEVYTDGKIYADKAILPRFNEFINPFLHELFLESRVYVDDLRAYLIEQNKTFEKVQVFYGSKEKKDAILEKYKGNSSFTIIESSEDNLELVPNNVSKGLAVAELAKSKGLTAAEVMTMGDSNNDLTMLDYAGVSFAMANGEETAKATAKYLTTTNDENGVAKAIELVLQNNEKLQK